MFERFTERSNRAMFDSRHNAFLAGSSFIEATHLLYALLTGQDPIVLASLRRAQVSADRLLDLLPTIPSRSAENRGREIPFNDEFKRVLTLAAEEADALKHAKIWTGHLLLGLLRAELAADGGPLTQSGVGIEAVRIAVAESI